MPTEARLSSNVWVAIFQKDLPKAFTISGSPLPDDHFLTGTHGIKAEFYFDGSLKSYLNFRRGKPFGLTLEKGVNSGEYIMNLAPTELHEKYQKTSYIHLSHYTGCDHCPHQMDWHAWIQSRCEEVNNEW